MQFFGRRSTERPAVAGRAVAVAGRAVVVGVASADGMQVAGRAVEVVVGVGVRLSNPNCTTRYRRWFRTATATPTATQPRHPLPQTASVLVRGTHCSMPGSPRRPLIQFRSNIHLLSQHLSSELKISPARPRDNFAMVKASLFAVIFIALSVAAQSQPNSDVKFVADTLIVQAEGSYETDPDLATLIFDVSDQEKQLKDAYGKASQSMSNIVAVAQRNGLTKDAIQTGVLTVTPFYQGDRKRRARAYLVQGQVRLKVQDFSKVGPIIDDSVQDGIADFRSLTYSLANEESAKQKAVADAMRRAIGRATAALEQTKQKLGPTRYVNVEVTNLVGARPIEMGNLPAATETVEVTSENSGGGIFSHNKRAAPPPPPPPVQPGKLTVSATIQCVFGIEK